MEEIAISIIIPTLNEEKYIEKCLSTILKNKTSFDFEILVVDGGSTDKTIEIIKAFQNKSEKINLLHNKNKYAPFAFNMGIKNSKGKYILILGAHTYVPDDFLQKNFETISGSDADCVGGKLKTINETKIGKEISRALSSPFGVGSAKFRYSNKPQYVDTVAFGCYKREVFQELGQFDEELVRGQDYEFNHRLTQSGRKIFFNPEIKTYYYSRSDLKSLFNQYYQYGRWKPVAQRKRRQIASIRHVIPLFFIFFLIFGSLLSLLSRPILILFISLLGLYFLTALIFSIKISKNNERVWLMPVIFLIIHISYGLGYLSGLIDILKGIKKKIMS